MSDGARPTLDPRLHPYKHDIAAAHLKGEVEAEHFVEGKPHRVNEPITDILSDQMGEARTSQALFGETFMVYQTEGYWAWGQLMTDGYVGWLSALSLVASDGTNPTHLVSAPLTRATDGASRCSATDQCPWARSFACPIRRLRLAVHQQSLLKAMPAPYPPIIFVRYPHQSTTGWRWPSFSPTPLMSGADGPRLASTVPRWSSWPSSRRVSPAHGTATCRRRSLAIRSKRSEGLRRGDLVFWPGHVGLLLDDATLFHANAFAMATVSEPLGNVEDRIGEARTIKRLDQ
jgi:hypothetical protein